MHRLTTHPTAASHIGHRLAIIDDLHHCSKTLFHKPKLHKHGDLPPKIGDITATTREGSAPLGKPDTCNTATGTTVTQQPELVPKLSPTYRFYLWELLEGAGANVDFVGSRFGVQDLSLIHI